MKYWCIVIYVLFTFSGFSQKSNPLVPPGTVQINDTLFADKTEIANVHWREFLYYLTRFDSSRVAAMLPDTLVWSTDNTYLYDSLRGLELKTYSSTPMQYYYLRHPMFNMYPIVGITHEQALEFCKWRTLAANYVRHCKDNAIKPKQNHVGEQFPIKFYYRLPTKQEWEMLASGRKGVKEFPYGFDSIYKKWRKAYTKIFNCLYPGDLLTDSIPKGKPFYTAEVKSFYPNTFGLYNIIGNMAEMVAERGTAKGGSFEHQVEECKIINDQHYTKPEKWLGFRCVAVLIK